MPRKVRETIDLRLIAELTKGQSYIGAAETLGINEKTVRRRMADETFRHKLNEARSQVLDVTLSRLSAITVEAADCLASLLHSKSDMARLGASRTILEVAPKLREHLELEDRVRVLEAETPRLRVMR
jgi:hypothetical protein